MVTKRQERRIGSEGAVNIDDLYDYIFPPAPRGGRPAALLERSIIVTDDWPDVVPITDAELRVMESHFAEELDELLGPRA